MMSARRGHVFAPMSECDNWFAFVHRQRTHLGLSHKCPQHSAAPGYDPRGKARVDRNPGSTLAGNHLLYNHESDAHTLPTMRSILALQQFMHSYEKATWDCLQGMCLLFSRFSGAGVKVLDWSVKPARTRGEPYAARRFPRLLPEAKLTSKDLSSPPAKSQTPAVQTRGVCRDLLRSN
jgi:hypothetical protein